MPVALFILWIMLNGRLSPDVVVSGLAVSFFIWKFSGRYMRPQSGNGAFSLRKLRKMANYLRHLVWEMVLANIQVIRLVLSPKMELRPCVTFFQPKLKSDFGRVLLANSITLTPGTITGELDDDGYWVHALTAEMLEGIESSTFVRLIEDMEESD